MSSKKENSVSGISAPKPSIQTYRIPSRIRGSSDGSPPREVRKRHSAALLGKNNDTVQPIIRTSVDNHRNINSNNNHDNDSDDNRNSNSKKNDVWASPSPQSSTINSSVQERSSQSQENSPTLFKSFFLHFQIQNLIPHKVIQFYSIFPHHIRSKSPFILLLLLFSPRLFVYILLICIGVLIGFWWATPDARDITTIKPLLDADLLSSTTIDNSLIPLHITPAIEIALNRFLSFFLRDLINSWYAKLNHSNNADFENRVHSGMNQVFMNAARFMKKAKVTEAVLPVFQAVILHMVRILFFSPFFDLLSYQF